MIDTSTHSYQSCYILIDVLHKYNSRHCLGIYYNKGMKRKEIRNEQKEKGTKNIYNVQSNN